MQSVFPHVMVWYSSQYNSKHALLMGMKTKLRIDFRHLVAEMNRDPIRSSLAEVGLSDPYTMLGCFLVDEEAIREYTASSQINDDNTMLLPHNIPKQQNWADTTVQELLLRLKSLSAPVQKYVQYDHEMYPAFDEKLEHALAVRNHLMEGTGYFFTGDYFNAANTYEKALALSPEDRHIQYMMDESRFLTFIEEGKRLTSMGALPEASQYFGRALEMNPQSAAGHNELGRIYFMGGFLDLAKKRFEKAISLIPDFEQAHFNLAQVHYHENDYETARKICETALQLNPNMRMAKKFLEELEKKRR